MVALEQTVLSPILPHSPPQYLLRLERQVYQQLFKSGNSIHCTVVSGSHVWIRKLHACRWRALRGSIHQTVLKIHHQYNASISHRWKLHELIYRPPRQNRKPGTLAKFRAYVIAYIYVLVIYAWLTEYLCSLSGPRAKKLLRQHLNFNCFGFLCLNLLFIRSTLIYNLVSNQKISKIKIYYNTFCDSFVLWHIAFLNFKLYK